MYQAIGGEGLLIKALKKTLEWKGISFRMSLEMASQAAYSLDIGMGFYLALGSILPKKISGTGLVLLGAIIDTVMAIVGLIIVVSLLQMAPASATSGTVLLFSSLPIGIEKNLGSSMLYLFNISLFLAAITSMVPIGEVTGRITAEILRTSRENGVIISLSTATLVEIVTSPLYGFTLTQFVFSTRPSQRLSSLEE
jgi:NSS family neurotransmitter:Na+ symporter